MTLTFLIGLITTGTSAALAVGVLTRWWHGRSAHTLLWGMGLLLYVVAGVSEIALSFGWSDAAFRAWYWSGALMIPPVLGQGTMHLLVRRKRVAYAFTLVVALLAYASLVWMSSIALDASKFDTGGNLARFLTERYREILPASPVRRVLPPILNGYGTLLLAGGAVYSAWLFLRKEIMPNRVVGNALIAFGGLLPALTGTLIKLADDYSHLSEFGALAKYAAILASVLLLWMGFRAAVRGR
jgi:hypothetical protein